MSEEKYCLECLEFQINRAESPETATMEPPIPGERLCAYHLAGHPTMAEAAIRRLARAKQRLDHIEGGER